MGQSTQCWENLKAKGDLTVNKTLKSLAFAVGAAAIAAVSTPAAQAQTIQLVYPFPDNLVYSQSCIQLAEKLKEAANGQYEVNVRPFNSIGMFEQAPAISEGAAGMSCLPAAFYARAIPENEAISTSNASPQAVRDNGGMEIIERLHAEHMNMKYIGWVDSGPQFMIYLAEPPTFNDNGLPNMSGIKMRDNPIYGAFFRALNAETQSMASTDVYPALERGVVNASAWTTIGVMDWRWDEFLKHALTPAFYQTDIGVIMNLDLWNSLSEGAQATIQRVVMEHEASSREARLQEQEQELAQLQERGMTFHEVPNAEEYIRIAVDSAYERMHERLREADRTLEHAEALRERYRVAE